MILGSGGEKAVRLNYFAFGQILFQTWKKD